MNRRPQKSRSSYDAFSPHETTRFKAASPDTRFFERRTPHSRAHSVLKAGFFLLLFILAVNFASNLFIRVERETIPVTGLTEDFANFTILHISDLKGASFGSGQSRIAMALKDCDYDVVLFTGDMVSPMGNAQPFYELIEALHAARPDVPIYFVAGDSDPEPVSMEYATSGSPFAPWVLGAQQRGATLLSSPQRIDRGRQTLWLSTPAQLTLDLHTMQVQYEQSYLRARSGGDENEIELATYNLRALEGTREARSAMKSSDVHIAVTHVPPLQEEVLSQIDLMLCGHYLGGLVRLPLAGPVFIPSQSLPMYGLFPGANTHSGLSRSGRTYVYTSPGVGSGDSIYPPFFFRLFNPPTVTLLSLTPSAL